MQKIVNWKARRAGGRITINGFTDAGPIKIVGVDAIEAGKPFPIATDKNGVAYQLAG